MITDWRDFERAQAAVFDNLGQVAMISTEGRLTMSPSSPMSGGRALWTKLRNPALVRRLLRTFLTIAAVLLWAYNIRWLQAEFPFLVRAQYKVHQLLSKLDWHTRIVESVLLVEVDDESFYSPPVSGSQPTNRRYLADLAKIAASSKH